MSHEEKKTEKRKDKSILSSNLNQKNKMYPRRDPCSATEVYSSTS